MLRNKPFSRWELTENYRESEKQENEYLTPNPKIRA